MKKLLKYILLLIYVALMPACGEDSGLDGVFANKPFALVTAADGGRTSISAVTGPNDEIKRPFYLRLKLIIKNRHCQFVNSGGECGGKTVVFLLHRLRRSIAMNPPQISVIIPVFNVEKFLPQCLDSLLFLLLKCGH